MNRYEDILAMTREERRTALARCAAQLRTLIASSNLAEESVQNFSDFVRDLAESWESEVDELENMGT